MQLQSILADSEELEPVLPHHRSLIRQLERKEALAIEERVERLGLRTCGCVPNGAFPELRGWPDFDRECYSADPRAAKEAQKRVRKWLYECGIPFAREVFVFDEEDGVLGTTWKVFVRHWPRFLNSDAWNAYVVDRSVSWMLGYCHHDILSFGSHRPAAARRAGVETDSSTS